MLSISAFSAAISARIDSISRMGSADADASRRTTGLKCTCMRMADERVCAREYSPGGGGGRRLFNFRCKVERRKSLLHDRLGGRERGEHDHLHRRIGAHRRPGAAAAVGGGGSQPMHTACTPVASHYP